MQTREPEHDKWFREQVEAALAEADDPNTEWVSHEIVRQEMAEEQDSLRAIITAQQKTAATGLDTPRPAESNRSGEIPDAAQPDGGAEAV